MGIKKGLKSINSYYAEEDRKREERNTPKATWFGLKDGESAKVRFLQELDPDSPNYSEKNGLGFIAVEHQSPKNFRHKALCTIDEESGGECFGCEQRRLAYQNGDKELGGKWNSKSRLYINVLVDKAGEDPYVAILSQGRSAKSITDTVLDYATETGTITNRWWKITRKGSGLNDTSYTIMAFDPKDDVAVEDYELFDLDNVVRDVAYEDQEKHYGYADREEELVSVSSGSASSDDDSW
jgi:hypothetical protein